MGTARFILANHAETATVLNGTGGSPTPPVRSEVSPFVMERALNADRRSLWKLGAQNDVFTGGYQMDLDLGSVKSIGAITLHGLSCPGGVISSVETYYLNTYPSASYQSIGALALNGRDAGLAFTTIGKQYVTVWVGATAAPIIGRVVVGPLVDLGLAPNPGAESSPFRNRVEQTLADGSININELGPVGRDFTLTFDPILTQSQWDAIESLSDYAGSLIYIDPDDKCFEVAIRGGRVRSSRLGAAIRARSLEMTRLP